MSEAPDIVAYHVVDEYGQKKVLLPGAEGIKRHRSRCATLRGLSISTPPTGCWPSETPCNSA